MDKYKLTSTEKGGLLKETYEHIVVIGTSTGGPKALNKLITQLTTDLSAAYVVVQHMPKGFTQSLANRLNDLSEVHVKEAEDNDILKQGTVYIAPGGKQLTIINHLSPKIRLTDDPPYKGHKPSVNVMYKSVAKLQIAKPIIAVIMTGMGSDGLEGIQALKEKGMTKVIAQDEASSIVYGMPKVVVEEGYADYVVPLDKIATTIKKIVGV